MEKRFKKCPKCGHESEQSMIICPNCGIYIKAYIEVYDEPISNYKTKKDIEIDEKGYYKEDNKIFFGSYFINRSDITDPIEWDILEEKDGKALIITHNVIEEGYLTYHELNIYKDSKRNSYEISDKRKWLNNVFYKIAFNEMEKTLILDTMVDNGLESTGFTQNEFICNDTLDKIFLLSRKEAETFYGDDDLRRAHGTNYVNSIFGIDSNICVCWFLRSLNNRSSNDFYSYQIVNAKGSFDEGGHNRIGLRPALWIKL